MRVHQTASRVGLRKEWILEERMVSRKKSFNSLLIINTYRELVDRFETGLQG